jgi:hypothetical protein
VSPTQELNDTLEQVAVKGGAYHEQE